MKQNVSETESNQCFLKKCKNMPAKQESASDTAFKTWLFSSHFNFASKDDRVTTATCKYCLLVVSPTVTNCCLELHLKYGKHSKSVFDNFTMHEN